MSADVEDNYIIAQASEPMDENGEFINDRIRVRYKNDIIEVDKNQVQYVDVSPKQLVSIAAAMIPFLEHDDAKKIFNGCKHATSSCTTYDYRKTNCWNRN